MTSCLQAGRNVLIAISVSFKTKVDERNWENVLISKFYHINTLPRNVYGESMAYTSVAYSDPLFWMTNTLTLPRISWRTQQISSHSSTGIYPRDGIVSTVDEISPILTLVVIIFKLFHKRRPSVRKQYRRLLHQPRCINKDQFSLSARRSTLDEL